jgi:hypothetical protein
LYNILFEIKKKILFLLALNLKLKNMKPILLFILLISFSGYTQVQSVGRETSQFASWDLTREVKSTIKIKEVSGSAYSDENFYDGQIRLTDSAVSILPVRYNVVLDELEFKKDDKVYALVPQDYAVIKIPYIKKVYTYVNYNAENVSKKGFLAMETSNKNINFYTKDVIVYVPYAEASNAYSEPVPSHFKKGEKLLFIGLSDKSIVEMPKKNKDFLKLFPNYEKEISDFLKTNKISLNDEKELLLLVYFIYTLY